MKIAVIGGGIMGLALSARLSASGQSVTLYEGANQLGGLSTYHDFGLFTWDRFYHVILPSDRNLIDFIDSIGLRDSLRWQPTATGYYEEGQFYPLSNNADFLRFPRLSMLSKARMAATVLYGSLLKDWRRLEQITCEQWLRRVSGNANFELFWRPLLLAKLGEHYRRVSAVFIWAYIKRLASARDPSVGKEQLGHVRGGYRTIIDAAKLRVKAHGRIRLGVSVREVGVTDNPGLTVKTENDAESFDRVVFTGPVPALRRVVEGSLIRTQNGDREVEYLGVVCVVVVSKREISPYYVLNIADESSPFTGVIGMSNAVPVEETGGHFLTYFPKYLLASDPAINRSDETVLEGFWPALHKLYPHITDDDVVSVHVNRARVVQPLQVIGFSERVPRVETRHPGLFVLNTSQMLGGTLNNNEVIGVVNRFLDGAGAELLGNGKS